MMSATNGETLNEVSFLDRAEKPGKLEKEKKLKVTKKLPVTFQIQYVFGPLVCNLKLAIFQRKRTSNTTICIRKISGSHSSRSNYISPLQNKVDMQKTNSKRVSNPLQIIPACSDLHNSQNSHLSQLWPFYSIDHYSDSFVLKSTLTLYTVYKGHTAHNQFRLFRSHRCMLTKLVKNFGWHVRDKRTLKTWQICSNERANKSTAGRRYVNFFIVGLSAFSGPITKFRFHFFAFFVNIFL